jgi:DNA-binding beta-propeller fold protein YncE
MRSAAPKIKNVHPAAGIEGGRVTIEGTGYNPEESANTHITFGGVEARLLLVSKNKLVTQIPEGAEPGSLLVTVKNKSSNAFNFVLGEKLQADVNPVDSPVFDKEGNLYVTYSGKRGETPPVSVYKITRDGKSSAFISNIPNATSLAFGPNGDLYVSSRFEGAVYRATPQADVSIFARDLGTPTGIAFDRDGVLFVGDRNGRILKVTPDGEARVFASIPESMVAVHLTFDAENNLLVSSPGLSSYNQLLMIDRYGKVIPLYGGFGRPQGIAVDAIGNIYVCDAKAGDSSVLKINPQGETSTLLTGPVMVGLAFDRSGNAAVCSPNAVYRVSLNGKQKP